MTDERPDSLAEQAAVWVPPWDRRREPDRAFQAAAEAHAGAEPAAEADVPAEGDESVEGDASVEGDGEAGAAPGGDGGIPPPVPGELGGPATVDAPRELPGAVEPDPTDVGGGPEVPLPAPVEEAAGAPGDRGGATVDAPAPEGDGGVDAGEVFDAAADDDVPRDADAGLPPAAPAPDGAAPHDAAAGGAGSGGAATGGAADRGRAGAGIPAQSRPGRGGAAAVGGGGTRTGGGTPATNGREVVAGDLDEGELRAALEAVLLVVDEPVAELQLAQVLEQSPERVAATLRELSASYTAAGHGFDLRRAAGGWRLYTRPEYAAYVERFVLDGQSVRLTQAALETLAVVAYKQPVTRSRIAAIRGVNCDGVMRTLVTRGLVEECGTEGETGAYLYRTTALFLEKLGLDSVRQLPPLAPFLPDDVEEELDGPG